MQEFRVYKVYVYVKMDGLMIIWLVEVSYIIGCFILILFLFNYVSVILVFVRAFVLRPRGSMSAMFYNDRLSAVGQPSKCVFCHV